MCLGKQHASFTKGTRAVTECNSKTHRKATPRRSLRAVRGSTKVDICVDESRPDCLGFPVVGSRQVLALLMVATSPPMAGVCCSARPRDSPPSSASLPPASPIIVTQLYCGRGEMENRIKEQQLHTFADRTSAATMRANEIRLFFSSIAELNPGHCSRMHQSRSFGLEPIAVADRITGRRTERKQCGRQ